MESVERKVYFDDVKLQMDAKLWSKLATLNCYLILNTYITLRPGEEYNRHAPPKPVDIFQMSVLEFPDRDGSPLFHIGKQTPIKLP